MYKTLLPLVIALGFLIPGCVDDKSNKLPDLRNVYGDPNVATGVPNATDIAFILVPALEGRFVMGEPNASWAGSAHLMIDNAPITLTKTDPGPQGGGGTTQELAPFNVTLEVRFANASRLAGYDARFARVTQAMLDGTANITWSDPIPVTGVYSVRAFPGNYTMVAELVSAGKTYGAALLPFSGMFESVKWTIHSSVFPLRPQNPAPLPSNYNSMADIFTLTGPSGGTIPIRAESAYDGAYDPGSGTDIGLQLVDGDGMGVNNPCADAGAGGGPMGAPAAEVGQASEDMADQSIGPGSWGILAGACRPGTGNYYHNSGMVPYVLTITLGSW